MKRKLYTALMVVCATVFVVSAVHLVLVLNEYRKANQQYADIQADFVVTTPTQPEEVPDVEEKEEPEKPTVPISIDFNKLLKKNKDVVGWLYSEGTVINYPVVQAADNQYYLHRGLDGEYLRNGTLYVDYRNHQPMADNNYMIYGHSMQNGSMFGMLLHYKRQSYYDAHPVMYYLTPEANYRIELFAGRVVKKDSIVYKLDQDDEKFAKFLQTTIENSTFKSDVTITDQDSILTMSTCSYEFEQARYILLGKLIPIEE